MSNIANLNMKQTEFPDGAIAESETDGNASDDIVEVLYDTECPVCDAYCSIAEIEKSKGSIERIDARKDGDLLREVTAKNLDIDEGMVVKYRNELYYGADAIHILSILAPRKSLFEKISYHLFKSKTRARLIYPVLKAGRNLLLRVLGRSRINNLGTKF